MGRIHGKDHLFRVGQVEQFRQGLPAGKCGIGGQHGRPVTAPPGELMVAMASAMAAATDGGFWNVVAALSR